MNLMWKILKDGLRIGISALVIVRLSGNKNVKIKNIFNMGFQIKYWIFIIVCEFAALFLKETLGEYINISRDEATIIILAGTIIIALLLTFYEKYKRSNDN